MEEYNIHQIRCPICGGRLFDVITEKNENNYFGEHFAVMIKCWKCRNIITLDIGLFKSCVSKIWISHFCTIEVEFVNGVRIKNITERNEKNVNIAKCNDNPCKSAECRKP